jgi:cytochrome c biogenesis protein CcdA
MGATVIAGVGQPARRGAATVGELRGTPWGTLAPGLLDGFNPCAMWVLPFLLSMPVRLCDRGRVALVAGTFVAVSGAVMLGLGLTLLVAPRWLF